MEEKKSYDIIIIGGGVAGITAGIYAKRAGRKVAIIEKMALGGQLNSIGKIENYPGFAETDGVSLVDNLYMQVEKNEIEIISDEVVGFNFKGDLKEVTCKRATYEATAIILALGMASKELGVKGESEFSGRGISYCAHCDGNFYKNKVVAVVGSGKYAVEDAVYLSQICKKVYLVSKYNVNNLLDERFKSLSNLEVITASAVAFEGDEALKRVVIEENSQRKTLEVNGAFLVTGKKPNTELLKGQIELNENGFIVCDSSMQTSEEGVFACGDVRESSLKQIATAVGDGALAGVSANVYFLKNHL